jgi:hypothetical protein
MGGAIALNAVAPKRSASPYLTLEHCSTEFHEILYRLFTIKDEAVKSYGEAGVYFTYSQTQN